MRMKICILATGARSVLIINKSRQCDIAFLKNVVCSNQLKFILFLYHLMANKIVMLLTY